MNFVMKHIVMTVLVILLFLAQSGAEENLVLKTGQDKANYATGVNILRKLKQQGGEVNLDIVIQGMRDELTDSRLLMTEEEILAASRQSERMQKQNQAATASTSAGTGSADGAAVTNDPKGARQSEPVVQNASNTAGKSVLERDRMRGEVKKRADVLRQKKIMQERGGG